MADWAILGKGTEDLVSEGLRAYASQDYLTFYQSLGELWRRAQKNGRPNTERAVRYLSYLVAGDRARSVVNPQERKARFAILGPPEAGPVVAENRRQLLDAANRSAGDGRKNPIDRAAAKAVADLVGSLPDRFEPGWCHLCHPQRVRSIPGDMVCREHA